MPFSMASTSAKRMADVHTALRCDLRSVATGAISLTGSHDRMAAQEPGRRRPVKAASRRSRSRLDGAAAVRQRRAKRSWLGVSGVTTQPGPMVLDDTLSQHARCENP